MELSKRQEEILEIVKKEGPITGEQIAERLKLTRATLRPDLAILTMSGQLDARPKVGYYFTGKALHQEWAAKIDKVKVDDLKSPPSVIEDTKTAYDAVVAMFAADVGTLSVVSEEGYLVGIISRKDLLKLTMGGADMHKIPVDIVMTRMPNVITITPQESVYQAVQRILNHQVDGLPVVVPVPGQGGEIRHKVIGRITKTNLTRLFLDLAEGK